MTKFRERDGVFDDYEFCDTGVAMFNTPKDAPDSFIHKLSESEADALAHERIASDLERAIRLLSNPETVLVPKRRHMEYDRVPVGHDIGYRCYDGDRHDSESAFSSGEYGDGLSENEAYADWLRNVDQEPKPAPRTRTIFHSAAREEPDETRDEPEPDCGDERDENFDTDLEPQR